MVVRCLSPCFSLECRRPFSLPPSLHLSLTNATLCENIDWVGAVDWKIRDFHSYDAERRRYL